MSFSIAVSSTVQTGATIGAGTSVAPAQKANARTFGLTGIMGTDIRPGDVVDVWGSNDGARTFQPLRTAANKIVRLTFDNPECVINDCCDAYATQRVAVGPGSALVALGLNCELASTASNAWVQGGNSFGATGVLGTTDLFPLSVIAEGTEILNSDGLDTLIGNPEALKPGNSTQLYAGAGGGSFLVDGGGNLSLATTGAGSVVLNSGVAITMTPGAGGAVQLLPRGVGAGDTAQLQFYPLGGSSRFVGFRSPDALAAAEQYIWPTAIADLPGRTLVSDGVAGEQQLSWGSAIQSGAANLTNGASAAIAANISATSRILIQAADVVPGAGNLTIDYRPLAADRVNGTPGSFKITAVLAAGTINTLDQSQGVQWMVVNG